MILASLAFKLYIDDKLASFGSSVYELMSANTLYVSLKAYIDDLKNKREAFSTSIAFASRSNSSSYEDKDAAREALIKVLVRIARRLEEMAEDDNNNSRIITDAGYDIRSTRKTAKAAVLELETPTLTAKNFDNRTNAAQINWNKVKNGTNYMIRLKIKSETVWEEPIFSKKKEYLFTTLKAESIYEFQIRAVSADGVYSDWSNSVIIYVS